MTAAELLPAIEIETRPRPGSAVIWMHGLGADGSDFVPIVEQLGLSGSAVRFVFPHAPLQAVTINGGYVMRAWYDIGYEDLTLREDEKGVRESQHGIERLIEREVERGVPAGRIVLAGFSQGGAIALQTGLRHGARLGGIMALSSYLPLPHKLEAERSDANRDVPVFMGHGIEDPIVPLKLAADSCSRLLTMGYPVEWHEYDMPHAVCTEEVAHIGAWLRKVVGTA
ncbi:MAG TPA: alpha/beta hydrolase [Burkholderiales bacterium]|nr:alpha/beta hydrolase [Burkholderiales bacterium]